VGARGGGWPLARSPRGQPYQPGPKSYPETLRLAVPVEAGRHRLEYEFAPPGTWVRLDRLSNGVLAGWFVLIAALAARNGLARVAASRQRSRAMTAGRVGPALFEPPAPAAAA